MKICVLGTGYVGLVSAAVIANNEHDVICVDNNNDKIAMLKNGIIPFYEKGLKELIEKNSDRLNFTSDADYAIKSSQVCFIAVGTPQNEGGTANLSYIVEVSKQIGISLNNEKIIVLKSTVPMGTHEIVQNEIKKYSDINFEIISNPEFLCQGSAVQDMLNPSRVVVGANSNIDKIKDVMCDIYSHCPEKIIMMDINSAQMTKYTANSFLALKISFINEISNICEKVGANIDSVVQGISKDPRIGNLFLKSGVGYGGSCFPKDVKALIQIAQNNGYIPQTLIAADNVNKIQREIFVSKITGFYGGDVSGKIFGLWGLSFKPETDDMREAPSITIINSLLERGARILAYDPQAMDNARKIFGDKITYCNDKYEALQDVCSLIVLTEWEEFKNVNINDLPVSVIFDGRKIYKNVQRENLVIIK